MLLFFRSFLLIFAVAAGLAAPMREAHAQVTPYMQLAEFVINVSDHIKWNNYEKPLNLCVHGYDLIAQQLLSERKVKLLKVDLQIYDLETIDAKQVGRCNLLYIATNQERNLTRILAAAELSRTLSISTLEGFMAKGGTIEFQLIRGQVKVHINGMQLDRWSMRVSQLLQPFVQ